MDAGLLKILLLVPLGLLLSWLLLRSIKKDKQKKGKENRIQELGKLIVDLEKEEEPLSLRVDKGEMVEGYPEMLRHLIELRQEKLDLEEDK